MFKQFSRSLATLIAAIGTVAVALLGQGFIGNLINSNFYPKANTLNGWIELPPEHSINYCVYWEGNQQYVVNVSTFNSSYSSLPLKMYILNQTMDNSWEQDKASFSMAGEPAFYSESMVVTPPVSGNYYVLILHNATSWGPWLPKNYSEQDMRVWINVEASRACQGS